VATVALPSQGHKDSSGRLCTHATSLRGEDLTRCEGRAAREEGVRAKVRRPAGLQAPHQILFLKNYYYKSVEFFLLCKTFKLSDSIRAGIHSSTFSSSC